MLPFDRPRREQFVRIRDLRPGNAVLLDEGRLIVEAIKPSPGYIYLRKTAIALEVSFINSKKTIKAHPAVLVELD